LTVVVKNVLTDASVTGAAVWGAGTATADDEYAKRDRKVVSAANGFIV
jgi:hypothetical protein